eukprot:scaffold67628_cov73-Phaeocystis_antarctica.AAC.11
MAEVFVVVLGTRRRRHQHGQAQRRRGARNAHRRRCCQRFRPDAPAERRPVVLGLQIRLFPCRVVDVHHVKATLPPLIATETTDCAGWIDVGMEGLRSALDGADFAHKLAALHWVAVRVACITCGHRYCEARLDRVLRIVVQRVSHPRHEEVNLQLLLRFCKRRPEAVLAEQHVRLTHVRFQQGHSHCVPAMLVAQGLEASGQRRDMGAERRVSR